jgi:hypothetical protein
MDVDHGFFLSLLFSIGYCNAEVALINQELLRIIAMR